MIRMTSTMIHMVAKWLSIIERREDMNIAFAVILYMIGMKLDMGHAYFICIVIFTFWHYFKYVLREMVD